MLCFESSNPEIRMKTFPKIKFFIATDYSKLFYFPNPKIFESVAFFLFCGYQAGPTEYTLSLLMCI